MIIKRKITTLTTDANGQATYRYDSTGIGDVTFGATFEDDDSGLVSKTCSIEDCNLHFADERSQTGNTTNEIVSGFRLPNTNKWVWEYDMKTSGAGTLPCLSDPNDFLHRFGIGGGTPNITLELTKIGQSAWDTGYGRFKYNTYYSFKIIRNGNNLEFYINNVLKASIDAETPLNSSCVPISTITEWELHWRNWKTGTTTIKNLKIKQL